MDYTAPMLALAVGLFLGMLGLLELGRRRGLLQLERDPDRANRGVATTEGAVFALLGLLIAFTFSGAAARFQMRRELITEETNAIGTAWLRLDLLPEAVQPRARELMRRYVDARLSAYAAIPDLERMNVALADVSAQQKELWQISVGARGETTRSWELHVYPALNQMFDIGTKRVHAMQWHPPAVVFVLLVTLALACALLAGFSMASAERRPTLYMVSFALVISVTVYVVCDIELPRYGLFRVVGDDKALVDLRASMQ